MASLRDIRKRIRSVKSSQKITKAMKLVAASKLKKAQEAMLQARPYARSLGEMMRRMVGRMQALGAGSSETVHPGLDVRPVSHALVVVITSDRGLCGAFNSAVLRRAERLLEEGSDETGPAFKAVTVASLGRKGRDYFHKRAFGALEAYPHSIATLRLQEAQALADGWLHRFKHRQLDGVFLVYNAFQSVISQKVQLQPVLPLAAFPLAAFKAAPTQAGDALGQMCLYEPGPQHVPQHLLDRLIPKYVAMCLWQAVLESVAGEHGARMAAMDAASNNARELTEQLTLQYNRARQAAITGELMDIVGGAEALQG